MTDAKMEIEGGDAESNEELRKRRIRFLETVLNIYRARLLSIRSACKSRASDIEIPEDMRDYESLREDVRSLQNDVTLLKTFQDCVNSIHNNITYLNISNLNDARFVRELQRIVKEISFFSRSVMKMYEENVNEYENIKRKQKYFAALVNYKENLNLLKEKQKENNKSADELNTLQKMEVKIRKINVMRNMKLILVGKFAAKSEKFSMLEEFRTPFRRNLVVDDFTETWDIGL